MDNHDRKKIREATFALRQLLEEQLDGETAWSLAMRLGLEACMSARGIAGPPPDFLAFAGGRVKSPPEDLQAKGRKLLAECPDLLAEPAALGWLQQFWHDSERAVIAQAARADQYAKVADAALVPATQVYSEQYMVDFLVENSLGALWLDTHPASALAAGWRAYVKPVVPPVTAIPRPAGSLTVCDPACGAGHFLLRAFELLYDMYLEEGAGTPAEICAAILNTNLFGMDIDRQAVAVARAALWLQAKERAPDLTGDLSGLRHHIVAAGSGQAAELGSLLTAQEAGEPLDSLLKRRYSVVITNPPYLDKRDYGRAVRAYLRTHYRAGAGNLYAAFILRCLELADDYTAMVTPQTFLFIQSYAALRQDIFRQAQVRTLAQLGLGAFSEAVVDAALFVLVKGGAVNTPGVYFKLTAAADKEPALLDAVARLNRGQGGADTFIQPLPLATALPGQPLAYWLGAGLREKLATAAPLKTIADIVLGMKTSDNKRFLRHWWEIWPAAGDLPEGWVPYEKEASGYRYAKAAGYCVRWTAAARHFYQNHYSAQLPNPRYWFKQGLVYGLISSKAFTAKLLPAGQMTDMAASCIFPHDPDDAAFLLGLLNSKICQWLLKTFNPTVNYQPVDLQRLPVPPLPAADKAAVARWAMMAAAAAAELRAGEPTDREYNYNPAAFLPLAEKLPQRLLAVWQAALRYRLAVDAIDCRLANGWGLPVDEAAAIAGEMGEAVADLPAVAGYDHLPAFLPVDQDFVPTKIISLTPAEMTAAREGLRRLYESGPGRGELPETFFTRLAAQTRLHPITMYYLIAEGLVSGTWYCPSLAQNLIEDFFSALVLTLLGHRWPAQSTPAAAGSGIIPLTAGTAPPLSAVVTAYLSHWGDAASTVGEFSAIVGMPLDTWLAKAFFPRHIRQFRKRPVAWQLTSRPGRGEAAFACLIHCRQAPDLLPAVERLLGPLADSTELTAFRQRLTGLADYAPAIDYGLRINIAPLEAAGLLAVPVLGPGELPAALADGERCRRGDYIL
jgi:hypothetical protein